MSTDISVPESAPGGMGAYRSALVKAFLFKFLVQCSAQLAQQNGAASAERLGKVERSAIAEVPHRPARGVQFHAKAQPDAVVGQAVKHRAADLQVRAAVRGITRLLHDSQARAVRCGCRALRAAAMACVRHNLQFQNAADWTRCFTGMLDPDAAPSLSTSANRYEHVQVSGEAMYTDDVPLPANCLHAALVTSSVPHARILSVDPAVALAMPGVAGFWGANDVPGDPCIGPVFPDETCFARDEVTAVGQVIGVVAADTHELARRAAAVVKARAPCIRTPPGIVLEAVTGARTGVLHALAPRAYVRVAADKSGTG